MCCSAWAADAHLSVLEQIISADTDVSAVLNNIGPPYLTWLPFCFGGPLNFLSGVNNAGSIGTWR